MPLPSLSHLKAFLIGLVVSCCRGKKSVIEGEVEADDSDVSDDEYVHWSEAFSFCSSASRNVKGIVRYKFFFFRQTSEWKPADSQLIYCFRGVFALPWCPVGLCSALTRHIPPRNETDWLLRRPHSILLTTLAFEGNVLRLPSDLYGSLIIQKFWKRDLWTYLQIGDCTHTFVSWHLCENITIQLLLFFPLQSKTDEIVWHFCAFSFPFSEKRNALEKNNDHFSKFWQ